MYSTIEIRVIAFSRSATTMISGELRSWECNHDDICFKVSHNVPWWLGTEQRLQRFHGGTHSESMPSKYRGFSSVHQEYGGRPMPQNHAVQINATIIPRIPWWPITAQVCRANTLIASNVAVIYSIRNLGCGQPSIYPCEEHLDKVDHFTRYHFSGTDSHGTASILLVVQMCSTSPRCVRHKIRVDSS